MKLIEFFSEKKLSQTLFSDICKIKIREEEEEKFLNKRNCHIFIIKNFPFEDLGSSHTEKSSNHAMHSFSNSKRALLCHRPPAFFFPKLTRRFQFLARRCRRAGFSFEIRAWLQVHRLNRFAVPQARFQPVPKQGTKAIDQRVSVSSPWPARGSTIDRDLPPTCFYRA